MLRGDIQEAFWACTRENARVKATAREEHRETKGDRSIAMSNHSMRWRINKEGLHKPLQTHTPAHLDIHTRTLGGSALARALAAAAPALVSLRAKSRGRSVLPNAAVICFGNATAVWSGELFPEMTVQAGQGDSSVCSGAGTLQVTFSKAVLNLMACKIR